jgi:hypothetical protein
MKFVIAALLGYASAATLVVESLSACSKSGINGAGLSCIPDNQYFATGMNGDEDLGEDIIMKGEPYHYAQKAP